MAIVEVQNVSRFYGSFCALNDVSFRIGKGQVVGMLGPNGAGKTTTMKILTGFLPASAGRVKVAGYDVQENPVELRHQIGYLPEHNPLYPEMTVQESLRYFAGLRQIPKKDIHRRLENVTEMCQLREVYYKPVHQLSRGFRQRVGLAQAMIHDPAVLILDEPTSGLDPNQIVDILSLIRSLGKEKTVIHSTHILAEAEETCDRILIMHHGSLVADDSPASLCLQAKGHRMLLELQPVVFDSAEKLEQEIADILRELPEISHVEFHHESVNLEERTYSLQVTVTPMKPEDHSAMLADLCLKHGWKIQHLQYHSPTLEDVFRSFTLSSAGANSGVKHSHISQEEVA